MLSPEYLADLPEPLVKLFSAVETRILEDIARRIVKAGEYTASAGWQVRKANELRLSYDEIMRLLAQAAKMSEDELYKLFANAGIVALEADDSVYRAAGRAPQPITRSPALQKVIEAGVKNTRGLMRNFTRTTVKNAASSLVYALDRAHFEITSGGFSPEASIRRVIGDLAKRGITSAQYASGRYDQIEVAVRRAIVTGVNQTAARLQETRADEMGWDLVEVSSHAGARPSHAKWQGQVYSRSGSHPKYKDFRKATGYGTGEGLCGWNCYHSFAPYLEGISEQRYVKDPAKKLGKDNDEIYEQQQKQRAYERRIRRSKRQCAALDVAFKAAGDPMLKAALRQDFDAASALLKHRQGDLATFLEETGRTRNQEREQVQVFGRGMSAKVSAGVSREAARHDYAKNIKPKLPKTTVEKSTVIQETVSSRDMAGVVPRGSEIQKVRVIAGYDTSTSIRAASELVKKFGGEDWKWQKKGGIIETEYFRYDVHWYEYDGIQYDTKVKGVKKK